MDNRPGLKGDELKAAIRADPLLSDAQKDALLAVYGSYVAEARRREGGDAD